MMCYSRLKTTVFGLLVGLPGTDQANLTRARVTDELRYNYESCGTFCAAIVITALLQKFSG